jgi:precorrin-6A/cobalt-precorrin-6A reductase
LLGAELRSPTCRIWLVGGTQESAELAGFLIDDRLPCLVTVTTESARSLYPAAPTLEVWVGRLTADRIKMFLQEHFVGCILDASHPFAVDVSKLAIAAAQQLQIPYLRYERERWQAEGKGEPSGSFESFGAVLSGDILTGERVLLTVGYRALEQFQPWHDHATLFARILPSAIALEAAFAAGFTPDRLIAFRPPISAELELALWQQWQITLVVTKASGIAGGEAVKRQVAAALGVTLITIDRPAIEYPQQTSDLAIAAHFCRQSVNPQLNLL